MFVALWEYEVKQGCEKRFEEAYGPDGGWVRLFRSNANYQETRLLRDALRPMIYLTLDFWNSRDAYEEFMAKHQAEYKRTDAIGEQICYLPSHMEMKPSGARSGCRNFRGVPSERSRASAAR
jgi:heme-degrading monooxygenase HmoA